MKRMGSDSKRTGAGWFGPTLAAVSMAGCTTILNPLGPTSGSAVVSWERPTTTVSGTTLTDLAGYDIYYGRNPSALTRRVRITQPSETRYVVRGLGSGTWYFVVTAYTTGGTQSVPSNVLSKAIP